jgi:hypothetical protein
MEKNPYLILEVPRLATRKEIVEAYRRLARKYHPDINKSPAAESRMREINWAYEVLSDPVKRSAINKKHKAYREQWERRAWQDPHARARARKTSQARHWSGRVDSKPWSRTKKKQTMRREMEQSLAFKVILGILTGIASWILLVILSDVFLFFGGIISLVIASYVASDTDKRTSSQKGSLIGSIFGFITVIIFVYYAGLFSFGILGIISAVIGSSLSGVTLGASLGSAVGRRATKIRKRSAENSRGRSSPFTRLEPILVFLRRLRGEKSMVMPLSGGFTAFMVISLITSNPFAGLILSSLLAFLLYKSRELGSNIQSLTVLGFLAPFLYFGYLSLPRGAVEETIVLLFVGVIFIVPAVLTIFVLLKFIGKVLIALGIVDVDS